MFWWSFWGGYRVTLLPGVETNGFFLLLAFRFLLFVSCFLLLASSFWPPYSCFWILASCFLVPGTLLNHLGAGGRWIWMRNVRWREMSNTWSKCNDASACKLASQSMKQGVRSKKEEARGKKQGAKSKKKQETCSRKPEAKNQKPEPKKEKQEATSAKHFEIIGFYPREGRYPVLSKVGPAK